MQISDIDHNTVTAGAYLFYDGYFPFMVGYGRNKENGSLGAVRFGGHREHNEKPAECARREIREETSLDIDFYSSPITYIMQAHSDNYVKAKDTTDKYLNPIFIKSDIEGKLSLMYFVYGHGKITPAMETQGILMLTSNDIKTICTEKITLKAFIKQGGRAIFAKELPGDYIIEPAIQLQFLNYLFINEPKIIKDFVDFQK